MDITRLLIRLLFDTACAAAVFGTALIAMEMVMPGSVLPYMNPMPFLIAGLAGLSIHAVFHRRSSRSAWRTLALMATISATAFLLAFVGLDIDGKISFFAIAFIVVSASAVAWGIGSYADIER